MRPWLVLAGVLLIAAAGMAIFRLTLYWHEREVLKNGPLVQAVVRDIGASLAHEGRRDEALRINIEYTPPGGQPITAWGELPRKSGETVSWKQSIPVHIDVADPSYWSAREGDPPLGPILTMPLICLPAALICFGIAWLRYRSIFGMLAGATRQSARVLNVKVSPLAPLAKLIGLTLDGDPSRRVLHCYWPSRRGVIKAGDAITVTSDGKRAIA